MNLYTQYLLLFCLYGSKLKMKILFTGHKGFLGQELIPEIQKNFKVFCFEGDLRDFSEISKFIKFNKIDKIIHAAARGGRRNRVDTHLDLIENLMASTNVLRQGLPTISFCSGKIYGWQNSIDNKDEADSGSIYPNDFYGQFKFIFRNMIINEPQFKILRYFNVFGSTENTDRFIKANILRYAHKESMVIYQDFIMDFFYVKDSLPIIFDWLGGEDIPKETNLVYPQKKKLSEICALINKLDKHKVDILTDDPSPGKNYFGNGQRFLNMGYRLEGLESGINLIYQMEKNRFKGASLEK